MSLRGRHLIDRIKYYTSNYIKLPVPPYGSSEYWDAAYKNFGPNDTFEWGDVSLESDLMQYEYKDITETWNNSTNKNIISSSNSSSISDPSVQTTKLSTTFGETIGVLPKDLNSSRQDGDDDPTKEEAILMIGCGNSPLGEDMIIKGNWNGPIIQVDVSSRICEAMSIRNKELIENGSMNFILDDATELSAFKSNGQLLAAIDKGLIDALFCADEYSQCQAVLKNVFRVLQPGGIFVFMSLSRPEYILPKIFLPSSSNSSRRQPRGRRHNNINASSLLRNWNDFQIHETSKIMLYRFRKPLSDTPIGSTTKVSKPKASKAVIPKRKANSNKTTSPADERDSNKIDDREEKEREQASLTASTTTNPRPARFSRKKMSYKKQQR